MRAGYEKLSFRIREEMKLNLLEGDLFVFIGKNRKLLKALCFDGTGLLLMGKRLTQGRFMGLEQLESFALSDEELDLLVRGNVIRRSKFGEEALTARSENRNLPSDGSPDREREKCRYSPTLRAGFEEPGA